jgi:hypothetical protein
MNKAEVFCPKCKRAISPLDEIEAMRRRAALTKKEPSDEEPLSRIDDAEASIDPDEISAGDAEIFLNEFQGDEDSIKGVSTEEE